MEIRQETESRRAEEGRQETKSTALSVCIWGTRGSCAAPFSNRMIYGGNTSCISVHWEEGTAIFDAGTGILAMGQWLDDCRTDLPMHLFISHLHLDHITGLPLFPRLFDKKARFHFYGPQGEEKTFRERLAEILSPPYWPVSITQVPAAITWHEAEDKSTWELPGRIKVSAIKSNHPDGCLLYRLERGNQSVVYGLDCEFFDKESMDSKQASNPPMWEAYKDFARNCSLLIFDAPYTEKEYPAYRGFGHSYWEKGLQMAKECKAARLCICHHKWERDDEEMAGVERELRLLGQNAGIQAEIAKEGQKIVLT